jgi:hypothetical protein
MLVVQNLELDQNTKFCEVLCIISQLIRNSTLGPTKYEACVLNTTQHLW